MWLAKHPSRYSPVHSYLCSPTESQACSSSAFSGSCDEKTWASESASKQSLKAIQRTAKFATEKTSTNYLLYCIPLEVFQKSFLWSEKWLWVFREFLPGSVQSAEFWALKYYLGVSRSRCIGSNHKCIQYKCIFNLGCCWNKRELLKKAH